MERIIRRPEVRRNTGYSNATIYRKMADGTFPKTIKLGPMMVGWIESEVAQHIEDVISASRQVAS